MQYLLRDDEPFKGHIQSIINDDGEVAYTDGLSLEAYAAECGFPIRVVNDDELTDLMAKFEQSMKTPPTEETAADFDYALNVLPPCRWRSIRGVELFHLSELLISNLAQWHARLGNRYFTFVDDARADMDNLAQSVSEAAKTPSEFKAS